MPVRMVAMNSASFQSLTRLRSGPSGPICSGTPRAVAFAAILIRQDVFAKLQGWALPRRSDAAGDDRLAARQHARAEHHHAQQAKLIRRIGGLLSGRGNAADICDHRLGIVVAQSAGVGVGHDRQPTPVRVGAIANRAKDLAVGPVLQWPGRGQVGGHDRPDEVSNAAMASNTTKPMIFCMPPLKS